MGRAGAPGPSEGTVHPSGSQRSGRTRLWQGLMDAQESSE